MILRAAFLLVLCLGSLLAPFRGGPTRDASVLRTASVRLGHESVGQVVTWLRAQRAIRRVDVGPDGRTLLLHFRDGGEAAILPRTLGRVRLGAGGIGLPARHIGTLARAGAPGGLGLVLEPFATELGLGPAAGDPVINDLKAAGYSVDSLYDTQVTVQAMTGISRYNVVYMQTHSGPTSEGDAVVATGELDPSQVTEYNGSVIPVDVSGSDKVYFGFTSAFIRQYMGTFPSHSLLFLNGCKLLGSSTFWGTLQAKNVDTLVTWDAEASSQDNYLAAAAFFAEMEGGMTVAGAISAEQAAGYGKSTINGQSATLGYLGDGGDTLALAAAAGAGTTGSTPPPGSPPPAPTTATPVTTAPTPVPTAVPTSVPTTTPPGKGPPVEAFVKPRVAPGQTQTITVHSTPGAQIRAEIIYPTGSVQTFAGVVDTTGNTHFSYVQLSDRITYNHLWARVNVRAEQDGRVSVVTAQYRILFSTLDVSVMPPKAPVGATVTIWAHTDKRYTVHISVLFPDGRRQLFKARTGAHGWASVTFTVPHAAPGHTLTVRTTVTLHHHHYSTTAWLTVK